MDKRKEMLKAYLKNQAIVHKILLSHGITFLSETDIWTILQAELELKYFEVIHAQLTTEKMLESVYLHINQNGDAIGTLTSDFEENDIDWVPIVSDEIKKAIVRNNGQIWVIHQNDADPHPSKPHAHNYQQNIKLDLYNGNLYQKTKCVGKLRSKELTDLIIKIKSFYPNIEFTSQE